MIHPELEVVKRAVAVFDKFAELLTAYGICLRSTIFDEDYQWTEKRPEGEAYGSFDFCVSLRLPKLEASEDAERSQKNLETYVRLTLWDQVNPRIELEYHPRDDQFSLHETGEEYPPFDPQVDPECIEGEKRFTNLLEALSLRVGERRALTKAQAIETVRILGKFPGLSQTPLPVR